jgi:hypothetical protein
MPNSVDSGLASAGITVDYFFGNECCLSTWRGVSFPNKEEEFGFRFSRPLILLNHGVRYKERKYL